MLVYRRVYAYIYMYIYYISLCTVPICAHQCDNAYYTITHMRIWNNVISICTCHGNGNFHLQRMDVSDCQPYHKEQYLYNLMAPRNRPVLWCTSRGSDDFLHLLSLIDGSLNCSENLAECWMKCVSYPQTWMNVGWSPSNSPMFKKSTIESGWILQEPPYYHIYIYISLKTMASRKKSIRQIQLGSFS